MTEDVKSYCQCGCGRELPPSRSHARPRKWFSEACRKSQYAGTCVDCGGPTNGGDGRGPNAAKRCVLCSRLQQAETRTVWTRERVLESARAFHARFGRAPRVNDWSLSPSNLQRRPGWEPPPDVPAHPPVSTVQRVFGSWSAMVEAAGLRPFDEALDRDWSGHRLSPTLREERS